MHPLPGQDLAALVRDLDTALAIRPPHLSAHHLTLKPKPFVATLFMRPDARA